MFQIFWFFWKETSLRGGNETLFLFPPPKCKKKKPIRDEPVLALHKTIIYTTFLIAGFSNK